MTALQAIRCECGGRYYQDQTGRAVCEACSAVVTMESLVAIGLRPVWDLDNGERLASMVGDE